MPFGNITVGMHQDTMHLGSAKRDALEGLAGIDAGGYVISPGLGLALTRDVSDVMKIIDRTSGDIFLKATRNGALDFLLQTYYGGVLEEIVNKSMGNVIGGYPEIGTQNYIHSSHYVPMHSDIDFSGGTANPFTLSQTSGSGTVSNINSEAAVQLFTGTTNPSYAVHRSTAEFRIDTHRHIFNVTLSTLAAGSGGVRDMVIGYKQDFHILDSAQCAMIQRVSAGTTYFITGDGASSTTTEIDPIASADLITIVLHNTIAHCFINGIWKASHTTNLPTSTALKVGGAVHCSAATASGLYALMQGPITHRSL